MENTSDEIEELKIKLTNLKEQISKIRKKGYDTRIAEIRLMNIPPKITMASITMKEKDIERVKKEINTTEKEIEEVRKEMFKNSEDKSINKEELK